MGLLSLIGVRLPAVQAQAVFDVVVDDEIYLSFLPLHHRNFILSQAVEGVNFLMLIRADALKHPRKTALEQVDLIAPEALPQIRLAEGLSGGMREKFHMVFTVRRFVTAENFSVGLFTPCCFTRITPCYP